MQSSERIFDRFAEQLSIDLSRLAVTQALDPQDLVVDISVGLRGTDSRIYARRFHLSKLAERDCRTAA